MHLDLCLYIGHLRKANLGSILLSSKLSLMLCEEVKEKEGKEWPRTLLKVEITRAEMCSIAEKTKRMYS